MAIVALLATLLSYATLVVGIAQVAEVASPDLALSWRPRHARALERRAFIRATQDKDFDGAVDDARRAFRADPTRASALATIGLVHSLRGQETQGKQLFAAALVLSRRDLPTHLWFIENFVAQDNVEGALKHFDAALRTSSGSRALLFPVLCRALDDPNLLKAIARRTDARPNWIREFASACSDVPGLTAPLARLMILSPAVRSEADPVVSQKIVQKLIEARDFALAVLFYRSIRAAPPPPIDDFTTSDRSLPPLDWQFSNETDYGAEPLGTGRKGIYYFSRERRGGTLMSRFVPLSTGRYAFTSVTRTSVASGGGVGWSITCAEPGFTSLAQGETRASTAPAGLTLTFAVPLGCAAVWLKLRVLPGREAVEGEIVVSGLRRDA